MMQGASCGQNPFDTRSVLTEGEESPPHSNLEDSDFMVFA